jgi:hypothetical protein
MVYKHCFLSHKIPFLRIQAFRKNKQGIDMAYFVRNATKIALKRKKIIFLSKDLPKFACRKISASISSFFIPRHGLYI